MATCAASTTSRVMPQRTLTPADRFATLIEARLLTPPNTAHTSAASSASTARPVVASVVVLGPSPHNNVVYEHTVTSGNAAVSSSVARAVAKDKQTRDAVVSAGMGAAGDDVHGGTTAIGVSGCGSYILTRHSSLECLAVAVAHDGANVLVIAPLPWGTLAVEFVHPTRAADAVALVGDFAALLRS